MKNQFDLKIYLSSKRELIIAKYTKLQAETFFNGSDLRTFGVMIYNAMIVNNVKTEKNADRQFAFLLSSVYMDCQLKGGDQYDAEMAYSKKHPNLNN